MTARKTTKKAAPKAGTSGASKASKTAKKKAPRVQKAPARKKAAAAARKPAKKAAAPARKPEAAKPAAKPAKKAAASGPSALDVNMGHVFALRPRVPTSFRQADFLAARQQLDEERYESLPAAARAVAEKALELTHEKGSRRGRKRER